MATDAFGRPVDYLRISVTDRCNLRCSYCIPRDSDDFLPRREILRFEEIERFAAIAAGEGIRRIRLTGGEPLVRKGLVEHVWRLREATGLDSIALTTNGVLLPEMSADLRAAGIGRVNISIDSLDPDVYRRVTGGKLDDALAGLDAALASGMSPVKLNVVVIRSLRQDFGSFLRLAFERPVHVRFIEYMPVGPGGEVRCDPGESGWSEEERVPASEIEESLFAAAEADRLGTPVALQPAGAPDGWGPARYFGLDGALGTVGIISPVANHDCDTCGRLRLTADGKLRLCLLSDEEFDVRHALRHGTDADVRRLIVRAIESRPKGDCLVGSTGRRMHQIGG